MQPEVQDDVDAETWVIDEDVGGRRTGAEVSVALEGRAVEASREVDREVDQAAETEAAGDRRATQDRQTLGVEPAGEEVGAQVRDLRLEAGELSRRDSRKVVVRSPMKLSGGERS